MLKTPFNKSDRFFIEPSDDDIQTLIGSCDLISWRPEDLPHFEEARTGTITDVQMHHRITALTDIMAGKRPLSTHYNYQTVLAKETDPFMLSGQTNDPDSPYLFFLQRPSRLISSTDSLSAGSGIARADCRPVLKDDQMRFVCTHHEIAHILARLQPERMTRHEGETLADLYALQKLKDAGATDSDVNLYVLERFLTGYACQSPDYFIAPILHHILIEKQDKATAPSYKDIWLAYKELSLRTYARANTGGSLSRYPSGQIHEALHSLEYDKANDITGEKLRQLVETHDTDRKKRLAPSYFCQLLAKVLRDEPVAPFTFFCGERILKAASIFAPPVCPPELIRDIRGSKIKPGGYSF